MWLWTRTDARLLGTWRSDYDRTVAELSARPDLPDAAKTKLASLFGKLELRYTRRYCYSKLEEFERRSRYRVLGPVWYFLVYEPDKSSLVLESQARRNAASGIGGREYLVS